MRLINNAAVYPRGDLLSEPPSHIMDCVAVNLGGMVNCALMALADMTEAGHGRILNVSTFADLAPLPGSSAYSVSKGAARIFTRALIADVCDRFPRIVINDWMPGQLATRMGLADGLDPAVAAHWGVALALSDDPSLTGSIFERDAEQLPPRSLKRRLVERVDCDTDFDEPAAAWLASLLPLLKPEPAAVEAPVASATMAPTPNCHSKRNQT